ncbi:uncharacterized protein sb:cb1058 [Syngnathus typhle]|uniref:uncharacterized protein sb:cb1058 n=1 Tax=Syngnathus typhle TaxID=161592 RepID=UPI002A6ABFC9|nr:uncharacterized protein sb:cb1058 [Syngnathus typhle]
MTISKESRKSSARGSLRAPKFLDKSGGFYDRLDEPESAPLSDNLVADAGSEVDDGETLTRRTPSGRWRRRSSRRKQKQALPLESPQVLEGHQAPHRGDRLTPVPSQEDADDRVLIRDKTWMKREQEVVMKVVKRNSMKAYRKAVDRAFRRGWEAFVANIYSVTLTPVIPSQKKHQHNVVLAEFQ